MIVAIFGVLCGICFALFGIGYALDGIRDAIRELAERRGRG